MNHLPWLAQAESDLAAARLLSTSGLHSQAVWFASQAVEKGHKAIIAALGFRYKDEHYKQLGHDSSRIAALLPESLHEPTDPAIAGKVSALQTRGLASRYPAPPPSPPPGGGFALEAPHSSFTESAEYVDDAGMLLQWCQERCERALRAAAAMKPAPGPG